MHVNCITRLFEILSFMAAKIETNHKLIPLPPTKFPNSPSQKQAPKAKKYPYSLLSVLLIILALLIFNWESNSDRFKKHEPPGIINWDVFGYYLYLPATFIYHDLAIKDVTWIQKLTTKYDIWLYQITFAPKGKKRIIYNSGLSYFFAPGFLIAHSLAKPLGYDADGLSPPYQYSILFTSLLVTFLGLFYLRKLLLFYFNDVISAITIAIICGGTNWFINVGSAHGMPHSFLFALNVCILYFTHLWFQTHQKKYAILCAIALAWAVNCRPIELIWILVPLFWNVKTFEELKSKLRNFSLYKTNVWTFIIVFILLLAPQFAYFQYASNDILKINIHNEKLCILSPYLIKFLFSYKKGWLLYTPIMAFAIAGFFFLFKKNKEIFGALFSLFLINLWITSSWENWWYAASFGQRPMVETYGLMAIPLGYILQTIVNKNLLVRFVLIIFILAFFSLNIFQSRQWCLGIIEPQYMTKGYYWKTFGKLSSSPEDRKLLEPERGNNEFKGDKNDFDIQPLFNNDSTKELEVYNKEYVAYLNDHTNVTQKNYFYITGSVDVLLNDSTDIEKSGVIINTEASGGRSIKGHSYKLQPENFKEGKWNTIFFEYLTPNFFHPDDKIKIIFLYSGNKKIAINNFKVEALIPKKDY